MTKLTEFTNTIQSGQNLKSDQIESAFADLFSPDVADQFKSNFLLSLSKKGETIDEVLGAIRFLKKQGQGIECKSAVIDCCGTGGTQKSTFNFSTAVSFVLAGGGAHVAKHGNKAATSPSGSADVLKALGVNILSNPQVMAKAIDEIGVGFLFAPTFYPIMGQVAPLRKQMGQRTIFNILGPLLNPASAKKQLIGVFDKKYVSLMAHVLKELGSERVIVVHSEDGLDEFSLTSKNHVAFLNEGGVVEFEWDPRESGYPFCESKDLVGGSPSENAARIKQVLKGHSKPLDHMVHINAAWGFVVDGQAESFMDGLLLAQQSISSGEAFQKLEALVQATQMN